MGFLRPLFGLTRLDRQKNSDIRYRLNVDNLVEGIKLCQKKWLGHLTRMDRSHLIKLGFQYQTEGRRNIGRRRN